MQKLLLLLMAAACIHMQTAAQTPFVFDSLTYEFDILKSDKANYQFSINAITVDIGKNTKSNKFYYSGFLGLKFDSAVYIKEFDKIMTVIDGRYTMPIGDSALNASYIDTRTSLYQYAQKRIIEKSEQDRVKAEVNARIDAALSSEKHYTPVGELILKGTNVIVKNSLDSNAVVRSVDITTAGGRIVKHGLKIELEDGRIFTNRKAPINFPRFYKRKSDAILYNDVRDKAYILLGDILDYKHFGRLVFPGDAEMHLNKDTRRDTFKIGSSLNQLLNVSVYTDLLGLIDRKPNGLVQTEISSRITSNTANERNCDIIWNNYVEPYLRLSKFDSKFASLDSNNISKNINGADSVSRTYLNQIAYLQAGIKFNVIRFGIGINQEIYINAGADINLVNGDSVANFSKDINFFNFYPELIYRITRFENFGMETNIRFNFQKLATNAPFENAGINFIFNPAFSMFYFPHKNEDQRLYLRFSYFNNFKESKANFAQFQLGYKMNLFGSHN
ncbi:MAG TPA: hypothetical protein PKC39_06490 [Ferruginibacter sp.]|nr:hypothetical protein [Ferruginibacter sp.]HMP20586.1 hypothetical protein [Ferruginibacter sp.]